MLDQTLPPETSHLPAAMQIDSAVALTMILPAFLEEENLRLLLPRLNAALARVPHTTEVIVVDTRSPLDATEAVCRENGVRYIRRAPGNEFGDAVRTGIAAARGKWIGFMDADGSHNPEFVPNLWAETGGHDVVIASRYVDGGFTENRRILVLLSQVLNLTYRWVLKLKVRDVSNSFKIYRGSMLRELRLRCHNFDVVEEVLYKISRNHPDARMKELPFTFKKRMFGETKRNLVLFVLTYAFTIIRLRFTPLEPVSLREQRSSESPPQRRSAA